jgi:glycosyltransferase involved in cell wall biosynthesis
MKIFVTGTRGIPNIPGGVEKHCEELYQRIAQRGHEVRLANRRSYVSGNIREWRGVKLINCYAPRAKSFEALVHTFIALLKARWHNPNIVHIHAIGPSLLTPFARLMGIKVVVTNHGPEYDRQKWGKLAKYILRLGEKMGGLFANEVIVISSLIGNIIWRRCKRESNLIYNGVPIPPQSLENNYLSHIGVEPRNYLLAVARFVPEKGLHDLIAAFKATKFDYKLVIAGDADHETDYSKRLRQLAAEDDRIVLTGYITGEPLNQVYTHARLFVLPSYHEGLPISLLEAMSYGLPVLVSDIAANMEVNLPKYRYFKCGDVSDLRVKINSLIEKKLLGNERMEIRKQIEETYNWEKIANQTVAVYEKVIGANQ